MPKKAAKASRSVELEALYGAALPERLKTFFDSSELKKFDGLYVSDLYGMPGDEKLRLFFSSPALAAAADRAFRITGQGPAQRFPLGTLGKDAEGGFLAAELGNAALPVLFFDPESGYHPHAPDFDGFLASLLEKGDKTHFQRFGETYRAADLLRSKKKIAEALELLVPLAKGLPQRRTRGITFGERDPGMVWNLIGTCLEEDGRPEDAIEAFEKAARCGDVPGGLSFCRLQLEHAKDLPKLFEIGEELEDRLWTSESEDGWYWLRLYLGRGYAAAGRREEAVLRFHQILNRFGPKEPGRIRDARKDLEELAPASPLAAEILRWFDIVKKTATPEEHRRNRAWWDALPPLARKALSKEAIVPAKASDEDLARMLQTRRLRLTQAELVDLSFLAPFKALENLNLENNLVTDLRPLAALPRLRDLDLDRNPVRDLTPLRATPWIEELSILETGVESLEGLEALRTLKKLRAPSNKIRDLSPLAGLTRLQEATLYQNQIEDLTPLASCPRLRQISTFGNPIQKGFAALGVLGRLERVDFREIPKAEAAGFLKLRPDLHPRAAEHPLHPEELEAAKACWARLPGIAGDWRRKFRELAPLLGRDEPSPEGFAELLRQTSITWENAGLRDAGPLSLLTRLDHICLDQSALESLEPLAALSRLRTLILRHNRVASLAPLSRIPVIETIILPGNRLRSLEGLEPLAGLTKLVVDDNEIESLEALRGKADLAELDVDLNRIADLSPLAGLPRLKELYVGLNRVRDLSPLAACPALEVVEAFSNEGLSGLPALRELPRLKRILSRGSLPEAEIAEFRAARPDVDID